MAAYGEGYRKYNKDGGDGTSLRVTAASLANSFKYMANPRKRAEMIVDLTADCDVNFAKAFWSLTERSLIKVGKGGERSSLACARLIGVVSSL